MGGNMKNNPFTEQQWSKLKASITWSERQMEYPKRKRIQAIREFVGYHYAEGGSENREPAPLLALAIQIYVRSLAAMSPRCLITTKRSSLKVTAANMELAVNQIPDEIGLTYSLRRMVEEALFSIGVAKVGLNTVGTALGHEYGESFVDIIPLDNYFIDMSAKDPDLIDYEGNQYWLDYEEFKESKWLGDEERENLKPDEYTVIGPAGERRAEEISADSSADQYRDRVWLRDVWLPREKLLLTMGTSTETLLRVVEWKGPERGPFVKLGYTSVPGNLMPLPPVALWRDLHELANKLFRKLGNQAESQKTVQGFQGGDDESVENFKKASDGDGIRYTGAEPVKLEAGGVDPRTLAFYMQCRDLFSYFAGNLDQLGGLGSREPTLGQDKLLSEAASAQMKDMSDKTAEVVREIFYQLAYYEWNDPIKRRMLEKPVPGTDIVLPVEWNNDSKKGKFEMYDLDIDIYSLQDNSPGVRLQKLDMIIQKFIMPFAQQIQAAGGTVDVQKILKLVGKYSDFPELDEIVIFNESQGTPSPQQPSGQPQRDAGPKQPSPGMSRQGADSQMIQSLMGGGKAEAGGPIPGSQGAA